ncbi:MAG: DUF342 domain-containing protein [Oscillospiraceae bacterium]|nr:DUF342 domain-containing protein [Oscillospiraceae bacterium]
MLQFWRLWAGNQMPPSLSLTAILHENGQEHGLDLAKLEKEWARINLQVEMHTKRHLQTLEKAMNEAKSRAMKEQEEQRKKAKDAGENPESIVVYPQEVDMDAQFLVYLSHDKLVAWLLILPPHGKGTLRVDEVGRALQNHQVTSGIDTACLTSLATEKPYFKMIPIAVGTPAIEGTNGSVVERFPRVLEYEVKLDEEGVADYKSSNYVRQVYKDTVICDIILPVEGTPGLSVDGKVIQPKAVRPAKVPKGRNTTITEDGLQMVATMDGNLEFKGDGFHVRPVMEIAGDVDYETGNIDFTGDVHVKGDVRENFSVTATGSVTVDGLVEAATVEAGTDLLITKGVVGDNRALLKCQGTLRAKYLESCVIYAGKAVYSDCIMNSQVHSDGIIDVTSGRGSVVGGALVAAAGIRAKMIGAESGRRTELTMGTLPVVQAELQDLREELEANRKESAELDRQLAYLEARQGMEGSDPRIARARMRRSVLAMKEQQATNRIETLEGQTADLSRCRLECDLVYPITTLQVGNATWTAKTNVVRCRVAYSEHERCLKEVL